MTPLNILGLITARGGSKGIPRKNITPLGGRPLIAYTCEAAQGSRHVSRLVISTDDAEIAAVAAQWGAEAPFLRPAELSRDETPSLPVDQHAVTWLQAQQGWQTDILLLLQPTSPLRRAQHIDEGLDHLLESGADTVVSVIPVPHRFHPYNVMTNEADRLQNFWTAPLPFDPFRRQNLPTLYARNGPAILACHSRVLFDQQSFYGDTITPYMMNEQDSIDIDTPFDLALAEWLLGRANTTAGEG